MNRECVTTPRPVGTLRNVNAPTSDHRDGLLPLWAQLAKPYAIALGSMACAVGLRVALEHWLATTVVWLTFWPAAFLAAWLGGLRAGVVATLLSIVVVWWWLIPSPWRFGLDQHVVVATFVFGVCGISFAVAVEASRRSREALLRHSKAMERARTEALAASRAKDEFLAVLSHELRNPLAPIATASALLRRRQVGIRELDVIDRQVTHLSRLVDDLLDISRIVRGQFELQTEPLDLAAIVERAIEMVAPERTSKNQRIEVDVPSGIRVDADPQRMVQVVTNLLSNAIKFSPPGQAISINAKRDLTRVDLTIRDRGAGMDASLLARAFDTFVQGPQPSDRSKGGLGLGLTIARRIVELHGGELTITSAGPGLGSEARVSLPIAPVAMADAPRVASDVSMPPSGERILVVDDNQDSAELMAELLRANGHAVEVAFDGPAALELVSGFQPTLALLDIGLPGMDGYELARTLRARGISAPLVAITGYAQPSDRNRAFASGFDEHLVKPVSASRLGEVVHHYSAHGRAIPMSAS
jgi:signal transduction histidine kinase/CheY-like chemotaxis protein